MLTAHQLIAAARIITSSVIDAHGGIHARASKYSHRNILPNIRIHGILYMVNIWIKQSPINPASTFLRTPKTPSYTSAKQPVYALASGLTSKGKAKTGRLIPLLRNMPPLSILSRGQKPKFHCWKRILLRCTNPGIKATAIGLA